MTNFLYVYAVQARGVPLPSGVAGFHNRKLFTILHRDLEAVVSELDRDQLRATEEDVLHHEAVVEAVRQMGPAVPVRFGTLMRDVVAVADALGSRYPPLIGDLERLGDKVELGLTVLWRQPPVESAAEEDEAVDEQPPGTRYLRAKFSRYRRDADLREPARRLAQELDNELGSRALERRCAVLPTPRLVVRAAYLLRPSDVNVFQDAFAELRRKRPDLRFLLTGPWPPYSFVTPAEAGEGAGLETLLGNVGRELGIAVQS